MRSLLFCQAQTASLHHDMQGNDRMNEDGAALQTDNPPMMGAGVPIVAEKSNNRPLQMLEANSGLHTSSLRSRITQSFPRPAPHAAASAALADAKRQMNLLQLQDSIDRLMHAEDRK